ncbi:NADPH:quinone reductase-like Zn-dependent oxidoreductase [Streptomyces sp. LBL]|uniref:NADP-dependent oxidoreductase n=1 Tax=Streptomyces sp. LBL TaxID=2940562 RepID=UPI002475F144|nr:NADP-dependent oxidoreductase [Streptomyces sp. LBL]MDH6627711.1 NADPH:quinone reductase-like Zn-dependent oxidoreductase [Streptomyces sp. LBL]
MSLAVRFSEYGTTDVLRVVDVPAPVPGPGQVRLVVRAAGVNPFDWKVMQGFMRQMMPLDLPAGLGSDVAGVVDEVGEGVTAFAVGDEVLGASLTPGYAQSALADAGALVAKPAGLSWDVAGTLAGSGGTAWTVIELLKVIQGETLLIHAASGGVGTFAAQLAVARGARVIGTASPDNHERLRALGVTPVAHSEGLADRVRAIAPDGVDAVLDASGHGEIPMSIDLAGGPERVLTLLAFDAADLGIQVHTDGPRGNTVRALHDILALIEEGRLQVPVWRTFPLTEAAAALDLSRTGHVGGKIVLLP